MLGTNPIRIPISNILVSIQVSCFPISFVFPHTELIDLTAMFLIRYLDLLNLVQTTISEILCIIYCFNILCNHFKNKESRVYS